MYFCFLIAAKNQNKRDMSHFEVGNFLSCMRDDTNKHTNKQFVIMPVRDPAERNEWGKRTVGGWGDWTS